MKTIKKEKRCKICFPVRHTKAFLEKQRDRKNKRMFKILNP